MKKQFSFKFLLQGIALCSLLFFTLTSCNHNNNDAKKIEKDEPKEKIPVKVTSITVGDYSLKDNDIANAESNNGFVREFPSSTDNVLITIVAEKDSKLTFNPDGAKNGVTLTVAKQTITVKVEKKDLITRTFTFHLSKQEKQEEKPAKIANLAATDFMGIRPKNEHFNVINSKVTWTAFSGATHYQVFINDERTDDEAEDGKLTKTEFNTTTGLVDLDKLMGDEEKDIKIGVKALDDDEKVLAEGEIAKKLPKKAKIKSITFNNTAYTEGMKVQNPLTIKVELNSPIKFYDDDAKLKAYYWQVFVLEQYDEAIPMNFAFDASTNTATLTTQAGLMEGSKYNFHVKETLENAFQMPYSEQETKCAIQIEKSNETALNPEVLKVLINDDPNLDIKVATKENIKVNSSVSIYFNQLVYQPSYTAAGVSEGGSKGQGIFITEKVTGTGTDNSRLAEGKWEIVQEGSKYVSKVTFKMVGKLLHTSTEPLPANKTYYIVIDEPLKTVARKKFSEQRYPFTTEKNGQAVMRTFTVQGGTIVGRSETEIKLKAGDQVTIKATIPQGKKFDSWNIGTYTTLTEEQKKADPMTYTMIDEDVTIWATFKE